MGLTFKEMADNWFNMKKLILKTSSISAYHTIVYKGLVPFFSCREVDDSSVQEYVIFKTNSNYSKRTIQDHLKILTYILRESSPIGKLKDYTFNVEYPTILDMRRRESKAFSISEIKKLRSYLIEHANENIYYFAILVGLSLGLRIGEITGLQFGDFDINSKMVSISRTAQRVAVLDSNNNVVKTRINIGTTKTKSSTRKLPVPQIILDLLVNTYAPNKSLTSYIFSSKFSDKPLDNRLLRNHYFAVLEKLSLPKITFHGLRHSFASNCIASNIDVKTTSSMLGHSDIKMTLEIYTHPSHEQKKQAINKLGKLFTS